MPSLPRDRTHKPIKGERYFTIDHRVVPALTKYVDLTGRLIWEPAAGKQDMSRALAKECRAVFNSDITKHPGADNEIVDFLTATELPDPEISAIVTNPPNSLNLEFAQKAIKMMEFTPGGIVALFQRHDWDTTQYTAPIFDHPAFMMKITLRWRPYWFERRPGEKKAQPFHRWAWYIWTWDWPSAPEIWFA